MESLASLNGNEQGLFSHLFNMAGRLGDFAFIYFLIFVALLFEKMKRLLCLVCVLVLNEQAVKFD